MSDFEEYDREEEYHELTLDDPNTIQLYKTAAEVANRAVEVVLDAVKAGASVVELCRLGDATIVDLCAPHYSRKKDTIKGVAHPTCIQINNQVNYVSPIKGDDITIKEGDMVKVYLAAQFNGISAQAGQTKVVVSNPETPVTGPMADAICAVHFVSEAVHRMLRPGVKNSDIQEMIRRVSSQFDCAPVQGQISYEAVQWDMEGNRVIPNALTPDQRVDEFEIEENTAYHMTFYVSNDDGQSRQSALRTTVYKRDPQRLYNLKMKASRQAFNVIINTFSDFAFSLRQLDDIDPKLRLGMTELIKNQLVHPYAVEETKSSDSFVAQISWTGIILPKQTQKLFNVPQPNIVSSSHEIVDQDIKDLLATCVEKKKKNKK
ncbi:hypothetical protein P9112_001488 [Eukaryota sp. TZLM1-RC]